MDNSTITENVHLNDISLRNTAQALVALVVRIPKKCRKRIEQVIVDAGEAVDTEAMKRPRSTDDPGLVDTPRMPDLPVMRQPETW